MAEPRKLLALSPEGWHALAILTVPLIWKSYGMDELVTRNPEPLPRPWGLWFP